MIVDLKNQIKSTNYCEINFLFGSGDGNGGCSIWISCNCVIVITVQSASKTNSDFLVHAKIEMCSLNWMAWVEQLCLSIAIWMTTALNSFLINLPGLAVSSLLFHASNGSSYCAYLSTSIAPSWSQKANIEPLKRNLIGLYWISCVESVWFLLSPNCLLELFPLALAIID